MSILPLGLPESVQVWAAGHGFKFESELPPGYCSRVFFGAGRILKVPFQGEEATSGALASVTLQMAGGPKIFAHDRATGAQLMEFIPGGQNLAKKTRSPEDEAPFIGLAKKMPLLDPKGCLVLADFYSNLPDIGRRLLETTPDPVFLHGDLHHENILFDPRTQEYRPIDPKGLFGDPNYECVAFLRNPIETLPDHPDLYNFTVGRILRLCAALDLDPFRVAAWLWVDRADEGNSSRWGKVLPVFEAVMRHFAPKP